MKQIAPVRRGIQRGAPVLSLGKALVQPEEGEALTLELEDGGTLPSQVELYCNDPMRDFQVMAASARRDAGQGT